MANKILMPKLSPTMEEGQISRWIKAEGDAIEPNETIAEVDTDKATMEMTSLEGGTLLKILVPAGNNAKLGQTIGIIGNPGEDISALLAEASSNGAASAAPAPKAEEKPVEKAAPAPVAEAPKSEIPNPKSQMDGRLLVSPIAARMATENGIDLRSVIGSGPQGRIIKRDIEAAMAGGTARPTAEVSLPKAAAGYREENTSKMRQVIAQRLTESIGPIPTFYLTVEIEMDNALALRKQINATLAEDEKVSVNDIIVKVAAMSLMKHPFVNASYRDTSIRFYDQADVGVAVAVDEGLITPVIRAANHKGFAEIARDVKELAARARDRKLQHEEYTGATFSISNLGMFGIKEFTAIINPPEAAILAVGGATPTPVVRDGQVVVRNIMNVTMSCDHRVIDGATGAKFLQTFKQMLENPVLMLV